MSTVREFALEQLHHMIRQDPWVREIMLAAGTPLDAIAEQLIEAWNSDDFDQLSLAQCQQYERMLNLTVTTDDLDSRRAGIQAAWRTGDKPSAEMLRAICDGWKKGEVAVTYDYATRTVVLQFVGQTGIPDDLDGLKKAVGKVVPAHLIIEYRYRYLTIAEVEGMTLAEMDSTPLSSFAGGE